MAEKKPVFPYKQCKNRGIHNSYKNIYIFFTAKHLN